MFYPKMVQSGYEMGTEEVRSYHPVRTFRRAGYASYNPYGTTVPVLNTLEASIP